VHSNNLHRGAVLRIVSGPLFSTKRALIEYISPYLPNEMVVFIDPRLPWRGP
jgi:hypothetical protein